MSHQSGEFELIRRLAGRLGGELPPGTVGIGDDTAAVPQGEGWLLLTCDIAVEGRHFRTGVTPWADIGWRVATANVSDVAACGGWPTHALISLGVPPGTADASLEALYDGLAEAARTHGFWVLGGNVSRASELIVDCFLTGYTPRFVARAGARPGDVLAVSGTLGDSAAGLELLGTDPEAGAPAELLRRHLRPRARTDLAEALRAGASAAIDISDGLSSELHHLAQASAVRLEVEANRLPASAELRAHAQAKGSDPLAWMLHGGEDYQLLFTYPEEAAGVFENLDVKPIGRAVEGQGVFLDGAPLEAQGWNHLAG